MLDYNHPGIPNPDTYLNHLSPAEGLAFQIRNNSTMFVLGAALWDVFAYFSIDSRIVRESRFNFNIFCFIFSRFFALCHIFIVAFRFPMDDYSQKLVFIISGCLYMLSMMTSSFLFLQRVSAIYYGNKHVQRGFFILWIGASLSEIAIPIGGRSQDIPGTKINKDSGIETWVATCAWLSFLFDTAVVLAISYKMWLSHRLPNENTSWYHLASGRTLPHLPRLIFRGGLQYYLIVVWAVMVTGITMSLPSVPQIYKATFPTIMLFLVVSMTSRLFRNVKLFDSDNLFSEATPAIE